MSGPSDLEIAQIYAEMDINDQRSVDEALKKTNRLTGRCVTATILCAVADYVFSHGYGRLPWEEALACFSKASKEDRAAVLLKYVKEASEVSHECASEPAAAAPPSIAPPVEQYDESDDNPYLDSPYDSCDEAYDEPADELPDEWYIEPTCEEQ
jgi:hypothetical protein